MKISVIGLGKLGSPIVAVLASKGFDVVGLDLSQYVVDSLNSGVAPVEEPLLQEMITANRSHIRATTDWSVAIGETDVTFVIVPTPSGHDGAFRNDYVLDAMNEIGAVLRKKAGYHLVVVNSTTMPGSCGGVIRERLESVSHKVVGRDIGLCYNPEFIALGDVINGLLHPDFVLIGESDARAGDQLESIYRQIHEPKAAVARMNFVNAEITKISVNTYVTTKISFANMLSEICERLPGADGDVVTRAIGRDTRIGSKYLRGATGYGGPCFPRDTIAFAKMASLVGVDARLATATHEINERQAARLKQIVAERMPSGGTVAILGLSYKPDTNVVERSQAIMLAAELAAAGFRVVAHDPLAMPAARGVLDTKVEFVERAEDAVRQAECVAILVPWGEYKAFSTAWTDKSPVRLVLDCWRLLEASQLGTDVGIAYLGRNDAIAYTASPKASASH